MQATLKTRSIFCRDNLEVMRGMNSDLVDLIYLDPPFNKKKQFTAAIGSSAEGASFHDYFHCDDIGDEWLGLIADEYPGIFDYIQGVGGIGHRSNQYYLCYMAIRLIEMHRILKDSGSLYLHCDSTMSHYLKLLLDCIFGEQNFRNEIVWCYGAGHPPKKDFARKHDIIYRYSKTEERTFNVDNAALRIPFNDTSVKMHFSHVDSDGRAYRKYASGKRAYKDEGKVVPDYWIDIDGQKARSPISSEYIGFPTQKPLALLERIIHASSNEGDLVMDPFCGSATTCVAAEKLGRRWIGIDISEKAYQLVESRLQHEVYNAGLSATAAAGRPEVILRTDLPTRSDLCARTDLPTAPARNAVKHLLFGTQKGRCAGCNGSFEYRQLHVDYILPRSKGAGNNLENLELLCIHCSNIKFQGMGI